MHGQARDRLAERATHHCAADLDIGAGAGATHGESRDSEERHELAHRHSNQPRRPRQDAKPSRARLDGSLDSMLTLRGSTQRPPNCAPDPPNAPRPSSMALLVLDLPRIPAERSTKFLQAVPDQGVILGDQNPRMCIDGQSLGT